MKKGFTIIEVMIVVAIITILAMIAVPMYLRYIEKARESATLQLLQLLALAEMGKHTEAADAPASQYIYISSASDTNQVKNLGEHGFRPDPNVGFVVVEPPEVSGVRPLGFIIFAAHQAVGSSLFSYDAANNTGVRPVSPGSTALTSLTMDSLPIFSWSADAGGVILVTSSGVVRIDKVTCKVSE